MKILKILAASAFAIPTLPITAITEAPLIKGEVSIRTVTGYGETTGEAYANAREKIPSGYSEKNARFQRVKFNYDRYGYHCYLTCQKYHK